LAVTVQALLHVMREETAQGTAFLRKWRAEGAAGLSSGQCFEGLAEITGAKLDEGLLAANCAAEAWLLKGENCHVPARYEALFERNFLQTVFDDPEALSYLGLLESTGIKGHNRELTANPCTMREKRQVAFSRILKKRIH
jgi:hypothetical protein